MGRVALLVALCTTGFAQVLSCSNVNTKGNGYCEAENNNAECDYDGGDCCQCTCNTTDGGEHTCGQNGFTCEDPDAEQAIYDCKVVSPIEPCSSDVQTEWNVSDQQTATDLANEIRCSGGTFDVTWEGRVVIKESLFIPNNTTVTIDGAGPDAEIDGKGEVRPFTVVGGTLILRGTGVSNGKSVIGGAITATRSTLRFEHTVFKDNHADIYGGALYVEDDSEVYCGAGTVFSGNNATAYGGGLYINNDSIIECDGLTRFSSNNATLGGGAVYIGGDSKASWDAEMRFEDNTASGEAIPGVTSGAGSGGALYIDDGSTVSWGAPTYFKNNIAQGNGGGLYIQKASKVSWTGFTSFSDNRASAEGGGLYVYNGYNEGTSSSVAINGTTMFMGNTCDGSGGGMAVTAASTIKFGGENVTFKSNSAKVAGGGLFVSGLGLGPHFIGLTFILNRAQVGGAVYSTGCGTAITEDREGEPIENPSVFESCVFTDNFAAATGGAMDSGAGLDIINFTLFERNTAEVGGALRLAGTTKLMNCSFIDNKSSRDEGPGVSNIGFISKMGNSSFINNTYNCDEGWYLHYNSTDDTKEGQQDLLDFQCQGCEAECENNCTILGRIPSCLPELDHSNSTGGEMTLEELLIDEGYWRATKQSKRIRECYNRDACTGGVTDSDEFCAEGYYGPYCSVCAVGYTASLGFTCTACSDNKSGLAVMVSFIGLVVVIGVAGLCYLVWRVDPARDAREGPNSTGVRKTLRGVWRFLVKRSQSFKIIIVVWQIVTQFASVANVIYPNVYQDLLDGIDIMNFDWIISTGCIIPVDFHDRLMMSTLGPLCILAILGVTYLIARVINREEEARQRVDQKHLTAVLLLMFLVYSWVSSILFQMFACEELEDYKEYLRADYRIECNSPKHKGLQSYSAAMIVLYTAGIPAFYAWLLLKNRDVLSKEDGETEDVVGSEKGDDETMRLAFPREAFMSREDNPSTKAISSLWETYKPKRYFYELVECGRRILLAGVVVFIYPNTAPQVAIALMMAAFFMVLNEVADPYASSWDAWLSRTGHAIVFTSMYLALLLKADVSDENMDSQHVYETILVVSHAGMGVIVFIEAFVASVQKFNEHKGDSKMDASVGATVAASGRQAWSSSSGNCTVGVPTSRVFKPTLGSSEEETFDAAHARYLEKLPRHGSGDELGVRIPRSGRKVRVEPHPVRHLPSYTSHLSLQAALAEPPPWNRGMASICELPSGPLRSPPPYDPSDDQEISENAFSSTRKT